MGALVDYAKDELTRAGLFDKDSDYDGMLGTAALEIIEVFAKQGHSGYSASIVTELVEKLMRFEPLTPLTYERLASEPPEKRQRIPRTLVLAVYRLASERYRALARARKLRLSRRRGHITK